VKTIRKRIALTRGVLGDAALAESMDANAPGNDAVDLYIGLLNKKLAEIAITEKSLTELFEAEEKKAKELAKYESQDEALRAAITRTQHLYDGTVKRLMEISLVSEDNGFKAEVIAPPGDGYKVAPRLLNVLMGGLVLGLLAGLGLAFMAELSDKGFRNADEIRRRLGLPVIGHIPIIVPSEKLLEKAKATPGGLDPMVLCVFERSRSKEAEAVRGIRTALYFSTQEEELKVIQVTSPAMGDGKSTLAANLAVSIAQSGKKVMLIDADFRRPRQHKLFGMSPAVGLASVIGGDVELADAIHTSAVPGLAVLPCGPVPPNPAELLTLPRFEELLKYISAQYDYVLIDTPPLLAVTDPCVVAARVDGVLLTLRLGNEVRPQAERARDILGTLGARILGVVVNGVDMRKGKGYGYDNYNYGYGRYAYRQESQDGNGTYYYSYDDGPGADGPQTGEVPATGIVAAANGATRENGSPGRKSRKGFLRRFFGVGS
jgi:capsular exopolysaccharide synthesis family protein